MKEKVNVSELKHDEYTNKGRSEGIYKEVKMQKVSNQSINNSPGRRKENMADYVGL